MIQAQIARRRTAGMSAALVLFAFLIPPAAAFDPQGDVVIDPPFNPPAVSSPAVEPDRERAVPVPAPLDRELKRMRAGTPASPAWGGDVMMTPNDSLIRNVELDFDPTDNSFYSFIWHTGSGGHEGVKFFRSTDGGLTWVSRASVYYSGMRFADADFVYIDSLAVCVMAGTLSGQHRLWCAIRGMPNGLWSFPSPFFTSTTDSVKSIALATDCDEFPGDPYIYLVADISDDLHFWRSTDRGQTWTQHAILETGGPWLFPDIAYSWWSEGDLYVTYYKSPNVVIARSRSYGMAGSWELNWQHWGVSPGAMPVVAAIRDSIQLIFNNDPGTDMDYIALRASTDAGANWYGARLSWADGYEMLPDITGRGGAFRASWLFQTEAAERRVYYARCLSTAGFRWELPYVIVNDHTFLWDQTPFGNPCVEFLPGVQAGVAYTGIHEYGRAWVDFVAAPWVAAEPPPSRPAGAMLGPVANPVQSAARLGVTLARDAAVHLAIFDVSGRLVATLHDGPLPAGEHGFTWNPGKRAAGVYFARLEADGARVVRKMVVIP